MDEIVAGGDMTLGDRALSPDALETSVTAGVGLRTTDGLGWTGDSERLAESEARYRTLVNSIEVGFCVIEVLFDERETPRDYRFLETNPAFERNTGLVAVNGKTARELVPNLDDFWFQTYGGVALTGNSVRLEDHAPAMSRWFDVYAQRVGRPEERHVCVFFTDITARVQAEQALRQTAARERVSVERERERLLDIFMQAPAFMAALRGPEHIFEVANPPYYQLIGHRDIIGRSVLEALPEVAGQGFIELLDQVYRTGEAFIGKDMPISFQREAQGPLTERFLDFSYQPLHDADGAVSGILAHGIDLTDRKLLERERERLLSEQQKLIADLRQAGARQRQFLKEMLLGFTEGKLRLCDTAQELPVALPALSKPMNLTDLKLRPLRAMVQTDAEQVALPKERCDDFVTAIHEAAVNAVKYGGGGTASVHGDPATGLLQCWVQDFGPGIDQDFIHRAVEQGWTTGGFGQGFFLMRSCSDRLYLLTGQTGTIIVLEMERNAPLPAWLQNSV